MNNAVPVAPVLAAPPAGRSLAGAFAPFARPRCKPAFAVCFEEMADLSQHIPRFLVAGPAPSLGLHVGDLPRRNVPVAGVKVCLCSGILDAVLRRQAADLPG